ncbi:MAG TPA: AEC family transporter [Candidatus Deferrimicrobiaceae bacterium]|nr:AEC family transporter [Candidatus Deferrimicrobiaceae bacterium]
MLNTVLAALLPMVVTFLLGFVAAWRHDFASKDASILNRMVLLYAVPLALFAGTVSTPRTALSQDAPLLISLCLAIVGLYGVVFLFCRFIFRFQVSTSALAALTASAPAVPFVGPAVLGDLFGRLSAIPIAIGGLVINLTVVPVTILLLALDATGREPQQNTPAAQAGEHSASFPSSHASVFAAKLAETVKEPMVWAPVLAFVIVLSGFRIPQLIVHSLSLLGHASGGVALFASGIVLASGTIKVTRQVLFLVFLKNIAQPALVLGGFRWLGYGNPIVSQAVLTTAIPAMPIVIMFALQYRVAQAEAASAVLLSVMGSAVTMGIFIALTS